MSRRLRAALLLSLAMLLAIGFSRLGFWQLDRAQEKQAATEVFAARQLDRPLTEDDLASLMDDPQGVRFRRLRVTGRYDSAHQFLLDNRTHLGLAAYHVYTLLEISRRGPFLMVNRGWVPAGARRDVLPTKAGETPRHGKAYRELFQLIRAQLHDPKDNDEPDFPSSSNPDV